MTSVSLSASAFAGAALSTSLGTGLGLSSGFAQWKLSYGITPIIFVGGIAANMPGGQMPIISITDAGDFPGGPLAQVSASVGVSVDLGGISVGGQIGLSASLGSGPSLDDYFALYEPIAGGTLEDFEYGHYPFANQSVAANAVIQEPLTVSMLMICPVKGTDTWADHLSTVTALQSAMAQHAALGGTYTVATPKFIYTNCLLRRMVDVTTGDSKQPQSRFQLDFEQPLITLQQAQQAQNGLMSKMSSGTQLDGAPGSSTDVLSSVIGALPAGLTPAGALSVLSTGVSSFGASTLLSTVMAGGSTMAGALGSLCDVLPAGLSPTNALQILSGVLPTGIDPDDVPDLLAALAPSGISSFSASTLLSVVAPGLPSPADMLTSLVSVVPVDGGAVAGALSFLSGANTPLLSVGLSGTLATIGQPITGAAPPTIPAAAVVIGAGVTSASTGAFAGVSASVGPGGVSISASAGASA